MNKFPFRQQNKQTCNEEESFYSIPNNCMLESQWDMSLLGDQQECQRNMKNMQIGLGDQQGEYEFKTKRMHLNQQQEMQSKTIKNYSGLKGKSNSSQASDKSKDEFREIQFEKMLYLCKSSQFDVEGVDIGIKISSNQQNNQKPRIIYPDDVFQKLQNEKAYKNKKDAQDPKIKVQQNLQNARNLLLQTLKIDKTIKNKIMKSEGKNQNQNNLCLSNLPNIVNQDIFSWRGLIKMPKNNFMDGGICSMTNQFYQYYNKHSYVLAQTFLQIQNKKIHFADIFKIKIIHSEYNRPELKLSYFYIQTQTFKNQNISPKQKTQQKTIYFCDCYEIIFAIFLWLCIGKLLLSGKKIQSEQTNINSANKFGSTVEGMIYKKSKHLKKWQKRFIRLQNYKLQSYRVAACTNNKKSENKSQNYRISSEATFKLEFIKEIWTRFQIIDDNYLALKLFKSSKLQKFEVAVPINSNHLIETESFKQTGSIWLIALVGLLKGDN